MSQSKNLYLRAIAVKLIATPWARGAFNGKRYTRPASKAQIMSAARKIADQVYAEQRREAQKAA